MCLGMCNLGWCKIEKTHQDPSFQKSSNSALPDDENLQGFQHRNLEEDNMCSFTCLFCAGTSRELKQSLAGSISAIRGVGKRSCGCWLVHQPKVHAALVQLEVLEMDNAAAHMPMNLDSNNEGLSSTQNEQKSSSSNCSGKNTDTHPLADMCLWLCTLVFRVSHAWWNAEPLFHVCRIQDLMGRSKQRDLSTKERQVKALRHMA